MNPKPDMKKLYGVLDRNTLQHLAGSRIYRRGEEYLALKKVGAISQKEETASATVRGTNDYIVSLRRVLKNRYKYCYKYCPNLLKRLTPMAAHKPIFLWYNSISDFRSDGTDC